MGLWSFVKDAGKSLIGKGGDDEAQAAEALNKEIADLGLEAEGVEVSVEGSKVRMKGKARSQEAREKLILAVGNVAGIEEVEEEVAVEDAAPEAVFHTVESGDTLSAIAKKTLGSANKYHAIFEANKPMLTHPDKIYPGQVLRIPQEA
jgi:nucleoid-associated protein YgaU